VTVRGNEIGCRFGGGSILSRNVTLDILKLSMAFMVVGLHTGFLSDVTALGEYLTVNGIFRIAVPIFLLINGFYFYPILVKEESAYWLKRVLYIYLFWMLFYSYFWFRPSEVSFIELARMARELLIGYGHLWYFPGLLGAAVLVILLKRQSPRLMISAVLITFAVGVTIQYVGNYHMVEKPAIDKLFNYPWASRNFLFLAFPFFCIGFLINRLAIHERVSLKFSAVLIFVGVALLIVESYFNYIESSRDGGFDNLASLLVVCTSVFLFFVNLDLRGKSKQIALHSTGVFVIHGFFLGVFRKIPGFDGTVLTFAVIMSSILASFFLITVNKRVKFIL